MKTVNKVGRRTVGFQRPWKEMARGCVVDAFEWKKSHGALGNHLCMQARVAPVTVVSQHGRSCRPDLNSLRTFDAEAEHSGFKVLKTK